MLNVVNSHFPDGTPICKNCGTKVKLDDNTDTLPPCPKCHKTEHSK
jgi:ribosomal protein S27AE